MRQSRRNGVMLLGVAIFALTPAGADEPYFLPIGDLPGGLFVSHVDGMSPDGFAVVGTSKGGPFGGNDYPYIWTRDTGIQPLLPSNELRGGASSAASLRGIMAAGGGSKERHGGAFFWTPQEGVVFIGYLPGGEYQSTADAISWDGKYIVGRSKSTNALTYEAYRWTRETGMVGLGDLPGRTFVSIATDISADGNAVVGYSVSENGTEAFRWTPEGGMVGLGDLPGNIFSSHGLAISGDGRVVVGRAYDDSPAPRSFRWTEETGMVAINHPFAPEDALQARDVSFDGSTIVGSNASRARAFIWTAEHGTRYLDEVLTSEFGFDLSEWNSLISANAVSADGRTIAGYGNSIRGTEGWIAYLGPPPCWGDMNRDNAVNMLDLATLLLHFGDTLAGPTEGDMDRDADVDLTDLTLLLSAYGRVCE